MIFELHNCFLLIYVQIGWPTSLPTSEKEKFMKSVLREKVLIYLSTQCARGYDVKGAKLICSFLLG